MAARMRKVPKVNPDLFPFFPGFGFVRLIPHVNGATLYYAAHLAATHEKIFAGVACPGLVRTGIFRDAPLPIKAMVAVTGPFMPPASRQRRTTQPGLCFRAQGRRVDGHLLGKAEAASTTSGPS